VGLADQVLMDSLFCQLDMALALLDHDLRYVQVSNRLAALNGIPSQAHVGRTPMELLPGIDPASYLPACRRVLAGESVSGVEVRVPVAGGAAAQIRLEHFRPVVVDGQVAGIAVVTVDVTEARAAALSAAALCDSERRLTSVIDTVTDSIVSIDAAGTVLSLNPAAQRLFGYPAQQVVGGNVTVLLPDLEIYEGCGDFHPLPNGSEGHLASSGRQLRGRCSNGSDLLLGVTVVETQLSTGRQFTCFVRDIGKQNDLEARFARQALHDGLTGLGNRTLLRDRLAHALDRLRRSGGLLAVLYLDLDDFKQVNDSLGHAAGDELLVETAARLTAVVRPSDTVIRLGGDEFVVLCEDVPDEQAARLVAERVVESMSRPFLLLAGEAFTSASVGLALATGPCTTADQVIQNADGAMYAAKAGGKAGYAVFDVTMQSAAEQRAALVTELRRAVERDQLRLLYQPLVSLATGQVVAAEALLRWQHPNRGLLPPDAFLPLAEGTALIVTLDHWVVATACRQAVAWDGLLGRPVNIWVNLSGRSLTDQRLPSVVAGACAATGLAPQRLSLEITESDLQRDTAATVRTLDELKALGVRLVVAGFGTGYSSLAYLRRFPIDAVKIDRSFVGARSEEWAHQAVVRSVTGLARDLGITSVAQGVETPEELAAAAQLSCQLGQGYLLGRPAPAAALAVAAAGRVSVVPEDLATPSMTLPDAVSTENAETSTRVG